jgi:hypothetical protein
MNYIEWRADLFGKSPDSDPVIVDLLPETYSISLEEAFDYIDQAMIDPDIHTLYSKEQIGIGLSYIYNNVCSDFPFCYIQAGDENRRILGIRNLKYLYLNFFERYCNAPIENIGMNSSDGKFGYICYMFWDIFVLYPGNASAAMIFTALDVMKNGLQSSNENCMVSSIHGLGHWVHGVGGTAEAARILREWLRSPTTQNRSILEYAHQATTGMIQ